MDDKLHKLWSTLSAKKVTSANFRPIIWNGHNSFTKVILWMAEQTSNVSDLFGPEAQNKATPIKLEILPSKLPGITNGSVVSVNRHGQNHLCHIVELDQTKSTWIAFCRYGPKDILEIAVDSTVLSARVISWTQGSYGGGEVVLATSIQDASHLPFASEFTVNWDGGTEKLRVTKQQGQEGSAVFVTCIVVV